MKKLFSSVILSAGLFFTNTYTISISEYILHHGIPTICNGILDLSGKNLTNLEGFEDIPNLDLVTHLSLFSNQLQSLPANVFDNVAQLQRLYLSNNQLRSLSDHIFDNLTQLKSLNLSNNQLQSLPDNIFDNLTQLKLLNLSNNQLQSLPDNIFDNLAQLKWLNLSHNQMLGTTQKFIKTFLPNKAHIYLNFKRNDQEYNEALEQNCFLNCFQTVNITQEKVNAIKILKGLGNACFLNVIPSRDIHGNTLLHKSVLLGNPLLVKLIAQLWPQMGVATDTLGKTPLHIAAIIKNQIVALCITKELLAASSSPERLLQIKDNAGDTPLRIAAENLQLPILQYLLAFEDIHNTGKLGKSRKLNTLLQQPDWTKAFEILRRFEAQSQKKQQLRKI